MILMVIYYIDNIEMSVMVQHQKFEIKNYFSKIIFSQFGFHWFVLNYNFEDQYGLEEPTPTYPTNEIFYRDQKKFVEPFGITNFDDVIRLDGNLLFLKKIDISLIISLLSNADNYCLRFYTISVPKIKYNTSYKCRLKKTDE